VVGARQLNDGIRSLLPHNAKFLTSEGIGDIGLVQIGTEPAVKRLQVPDGNSAWTKLAQSKKPKYPVYSTKTDTYVLDFRTGPGAFPETHEMTVK
jgi:hypothetical protein